MLEEHGEKWGGKVRILGLSIDNDAATVKAHVESKKWTLPEHFHVKAAGCKASDMFGIRGVPHVLLVDKEGTIVFKGHPAKRQNLEEDFDTLLAGGQLKGVEAPGASAESNDKLVDDDKAKTASEKFWKDAKDMMDKDGDKFADFPRAFLVLVDEAKFDAKTQQISHKMTCHTQIMGGTQEKQEAVKEILKNHNQGPWENEDMFRL